MCALSHFECVVVVGGSSISECRCPPGEKRRLPEALTLEDAKRIRVMGDIPMELVNEVMMTVTDPAAMLGPEVGVTGHGGAPAEGAGG